MVVTCGSILNLPFLEKMKIVAGEKGLNRIVRWVHVMEYPEYSNWLNGGELILFSGAAIQNDVEKFVDFIKDINSRNVSGLAVNIGPYIKKTPDEVINLANTLEFPIFEFPFEVKFIEVSQSICKAIFENKIEQQSRENFMKDIILRASTFTEDVLDRAISYGYDPNEAYYSFVISLENLNEITVENGIHNTEKMMQIKQKVEQIVMNMLSKKRKSSIEITEDSSIILMIPEDKDYFYKNSIVETGEELVTSINAEIKKLNVNIGIGGLCDELSDFKRSVNDARRVLKLLRSCGLINYVKCYEDVGIYKLFFEMNSQSEMKKFYLSTLSALIEYDKKNSTELVETLEVYIEEDRNLNKTSERLFIHKNTLKYRIKRIEDISKCDLKNVNEMFDFYISFKIAKFLKMGHFNN